MGRGWARKLRGHPCPLLANALFASYNTSSSTYIKCFLNDGRPPLILISAVQSYFYQI